MLRHHQTFNVLPELTQYGIRLPFTVAVVGQTDSGKTHSITHRCLGRKISFWHPDNDDSCSHHVATLFVLQF